MRWARDAAAIVRENCFGEDPPSATSSIYQFVNVTADELLLYSSTHSDSPELGAAMSSVIYTPLGMGSGVGFAVGCSVGVGVAVGLGVGVGEAEIEIVGVGVLVAVGSTFGVGVVLGSGVGVVLGSGVGDGERRCQR